MSVNRAAAKGRSRRRSPVVRVMTTGAFWLVLGLCSFLVGALLVSPIVNALFPVETKPSTPQAQPSVQAPPSASAQPTPPAPTPSRAALARDAEPDVSVAPVRRRRAQARRPAAPAADAATGADATDAVGAADGADASTGDRPAHRRSSVRSTSPSGADATMDGSSSAGADEAGAAPHRTRAGRPKRDAGADREPSAASTRRKPAVRPKPEKPIQTGDTIE